MKTFVFIAASKGGNCQYKHFVNEDAARAGMQFISMCAKQKGVFIEGSAHYVKTIEVCYTIVKVDEYTDLEILRAVSEKLHKNNTLIARRAGYTINFTPEQGEPTPEETRQGLAELIAIKEEALLIERAKYMAISEMLEESTPATSSKACEVLRGALRGVKGVAVKTYQVIKKWCYNLASVAAMGVALVAALLTFAGVMHLFAWLLGFTGFVFGVDFGELSAWVKLVIFAVLGFTVALDRK